MLNLAMKPVMRIAKWIACIFGGACAAAFVACFVAVFLFGLHDTEKTVKFLEFWARGAVAVGAAVGAFIVLRSERPAAS